MSEMAMQKSLEHKETKFGAEAGIVKVGIAESLDESGDYPLSP